MVAAAVLGAGAIGAVASSSSASKAASAETSAANNADATQLAMYNQTRSDQAPWRTAGAGALSALQYGLGLGSATTPTQELQTESNFDPNAFGAANQDDLKDYNANAANLTKQGISKADFLYSDWQKSGGNRAFTGNTNYQQQAAAAPSASPGTSAAGATGFGGLLAPFSTTKFQEDPGYQFDLEQGEQGINRNALASGRYNSGATLKDLGTFDTGLADQTYSNAFSRYQSQQQQQYNELAGLAGTGQTATNATDAAGTTTAGNIGSGLISAGNASAAGIIGSTNAYTNAISSGLNYLSKSNATNSLSPTSSPSGYSPPANDWD